MWNSEATDQAHVHVVIIGFSNQLTQPKTIYQNEGPKTAEEINPYLIDAPFTIIKKRAKPISSSAPKMINGNEPRDGNNLILEPEERDALLAESPFMDRYMRGYVSSTDFINGKTRYCLWLKDADMSEVNKSEIVRGRLRSCGEYRQKSKQKQAHAAAATPQLFASERQPKEDYLLIPVVSSARREYIPIGYVSNALVSSNANMMIPAATLYDFGVLTSQFHNAWTRVIAGRLKSDYRYSNTMVYNNFIWPNPTSTQKEAIGQAAQAALDTRALYPDKSLAQLYDPDKMPTDLLAAHKALDKAVEDAYGVDFNGDEERIVAHLFKLYADRI